MRFSVRSFRDVLVILFALVFALSSASCGYGDAKGGDEHGAPPAFSDPMSQARSAGDATSKPSARVYEGSQFDFENRVIGLQERFRIALGESNPLIRTEQVEVAEREVESFVQDVEGLSVTSWFGVIQDMRLERDPGTTTTGIVLSVRAFHSTSLSLRNHDLQSKTTTIPLDRFRAYRTGDLVKVAFRISPGAPFDRYRLIDGRMTTPALSGVLLAIQPATPTPFARESALQADPQAVLAFADEHETDPFPNETKWHGNDEEGFQYFYLRRAPWDACAVKVAGEPFAFSDWDFEDAWAEQREKQAWSVSYASTVGEIALLRAAVSATRSVGMSAARLRAAANRRSGGLSIGADREIRKAGEFIISNHYETEGVRARSIIRAKLVRAVNLDGYCEAMDLFSKSGDASTRNSDARSIENRRIRVALPYLPGMSTLFTWGKTNAYAVAQAASAGAARKNISLSEFILAQPRADHPFWGTSKDPFRQFEFWSLSARAGSGSAPPPRRRLANQSNSATSQSAVNPEAPVVGDLVLRPQVIAWRNPAVKQQHGAAHIFGVDKKDSLGLRKDEPHHVLGWNSAVLLLEVEDELQRHKLFEKGQEVLLIIPGDGRPLLSYLNQSPRDSFEFIVEYRLFYRDDHRNDSYSLVLQYDWITGL